MNSMVDGFVFIVDKVDKLLDHHRMERLQVECGLRKEAPIDRYLQDIEQITEANRHHPKQNVKPQANSRNDKVLFWLVIS